MAAKAIPAAISKTAEFASVDERRFDFDCNSISIEVCVSTSRWREMVDIGPGLLGGAADPFVIALARSAMVASSMDEPGRSTSFASTSDSRRVLEAGTPRNDSSATTT